MYFICILKRIKINKVASLLHSIMCWRTNTIQKFVVPNSKLWRRKTDYATTRKAPTLSQHYAGTLNGRHCCAEARVHCIISTIRLSPPTIRVYVALCRTHYFSTATRHRSCRCVY